MIQWFPQLCFFRQPTHLDGLVLSPPPLVAEVDFKALKLDSAAYVMDQVLPLPFAPDPQIVLSFRLGHGNTSLCRLHFGKVIP